MPCSVYLGVIAVLVLSMAVQASEMLFIGVDPADRLMNSRILGEFNSGTEGWTGSGVSGLTASGGCLTGTGTSTSPSVKLTNFTTIDLDFGFNDYLQIRMQIPIGFSGDIVFNYGTSVNSGFSSARTFSIPAGSLIADGNMHTYRLDLGMEVWWRDFLKDLQILPFSNAGQGLTFCIDYIEVGDLPGDIYLLNTDLNINTAAGETLAQCSNLQSKHAALWWSNTTWTMDGKVPGDAAWFGDVEKRRAIRMVEECYQVYTKLLGYVCPLYDVDGSTPGKYKMNHTTWYGGFWMGGHNGFMYFNVGPGGLKDEGVGNPVPHEFGHCFQGAQPGFLSGGHWESHANYLRNARNLYYKDYITMAHISSFAQGEWVLRFTNFRQDHPSQIYGDFRIHEAIAESGPELGMPDITTRLWTEGSKDQTVYDKIESILYPTEDLGDIVASGLRRWSFLDLGYDNLYQQAYWNDAQGKTDFKYYITAHLIPSQDKPGWYRVPFEKAPEKFAFITHELVPNSSSVTVEFQGFDLLGETEDWRWSLVATDNNWQNPRYSPVFDPGTQSFTMNAGETKLFLVVVPTPSDTSLNLNQYDNLAPVDKCKDRLHYAYEVRLVNSVPAVAQRQYDSTTTTGHVHSNGGGWVANTATVQTSAYVGPKARVLGTAKVYGNARIEDYAVVMNNATVQDNAVVSGHACVFHNAIVKGNAKVRDRAVVYDSAVVEGNAVIEDYAMARDRVRFTDSAIARGCSAPFGAATVYSGSAIADYDNALWFSVSSGTHFSHVPWGEWYGSYYSQTLRKPNGLIASYRIEEKEGDICWDEFGAQHALLRNNPARVNNPDMNSVVMDLNGLDQYLVLDRSLCDVKNGSLGIWINPDDNTSRPIIFMGASDSRSLRLFLAESGKAGFYITAGTVSSSLTSTSTIPVGSWTYLTVTCSGSVLKLYVNGVLEASEATSIQFEDVLGPNDYAAAEGFYIGRDWIGTTFDGRIEDIRFYNVAMTQSEISDEMVRGGSCIGVLYSGVEQIFDGFATEAQSGVRNGMVRALEAEINPDTSDDVDYYEGVFDSSDEENGSYLGSGFGLDNGQIVVRLDGVGFWNTGVPVTLGVWQKITLEFNGTNATLYVNGVSRATQAYSASASSIAGKNYRIGFAQRAGDKVKFYYDGKIRNVRIYDRLAASASDTSAPAPDPAAWAAKPYSAGPSIIMMTAVTGSDASAPIEYYFEETSGNPGGTDSGWQVSPHYMDDGLFNGVTYSYRVRMRDSLGYISDWSSVFSAKPSRNPSAWYKFDNTVLDSANANHATAYGSPVYTAAGKYSRAIDLDGVDDYVKAPAGIATSDDITIATWVKVDTNRMWARVFDFGNGTGQYLFLCPYSGGNTLRFAIKNNSGEQLLEAPVLSISQWVHTAVTLNGNIGKLYVNGAVVDTESISLDPTDFNPQMNYIGKSQWPDPLLDGKVDDFRIYNFALSDSEINAVYQGIILDSDPPTPNPATFAVVPFAVSSSTVSMTATTGYDVSTPVEYYFQETSGNPGGTDSGWQLSPSYTDTGLAPMTTYTYLVRMRDANGNTTANSLPGHVLTGPTADIARDGIVDLRDFAALADQWLASDCAACTWCDGADLDVSGVVDYGDLLIITSNWLVSGSF